jgi:hypothetical protein
MKYFDILSQNAYKEKMLKDNLLYCGTITYISQYLGAIYSFILSPIDTINNQKNQQAPP